MDAIDILVKEHRHIERVMDVLELATASSSQPCSSSWSCSRELRRKRP